jgi:arylsulfatase A-like enzyme
VRGLVHADGKRAPGKGTHATLGLFDMQNTLVAAGPDFRRGFVAELPSGNVDLAPTILHILGIDPPEPLDGRVLREAMTGSGHPAAAKPVRERVVAGRDLPAGRWEQYLEISRVGDTPYFDEGNGGFTPRAAEQ